MIWTTGTFAFMPSILALNGVREVMQNLSGNSEIKDRIQGCLENIKPFLEINPGLILIGAKTICLIILQLSQMPNWPRGCNKVGNEKLPHTDFPAAGFGHCGHKAIWAVCHNVSGRHNCPFSPVVSFYPPVGYSSSLHGYYGESCPPGALVWKPGAEWWEVVLK